MSTVQVPKLVLPMQRYVLDSGAVLIVSPRPGSSICAISVHIRGGPALDPKGKEGTAFLAGSLVDQGTREHDDEAIAELLEPEGGELSGDAAGVSGSIVNDRWKLLLELCAQMVIHPTYPQDKFALQQKRLLDRLLVERDDPRTQAGLGFRHLIYGDHWLGRAAYGSIQSIHRIRAADLRAHHREHWVARRGIIAVCGDVDPKQVKREVERLFQRWKSGQALATTPPQFPDRAHASTVFAAKRAQVHVYLGHLGIPRRHPDYATLVVMDHVLGTGPGFTNRIARVLRDELGLAYSVNANIHASAGILPGTFTAYIGTSPQHVATAIDGFKREMRRLQTEAVPEEELEIAKSYLIGSFPLGFERASRRAGYLVSAEVHQFPEDALERLLESFATVSSADVQRVAQTHLHPDSCAISAAGPIRAKDLAAIARGKTLATTH